MDGAPSWGSIHATLRRGVGGGSGSGRRRRQKVGVLGVETHEIARRDACRSAHIVRHAVESPTLIDGSAGLHVIHGCRDAATPCDKQRREQQSSHRLHQYPQGGELNYLYYTIDIMFKQ